MAETGAQNQTQKQSQIQTETKQYSTKELLGRFVPYFKKYRGTLVLDLFCAAMTTVCELVLPLIMRYITNEGIRDLASLSVKTVGGLGLLYFGLRIVDCLASYYMADMGHVMGVLQPSALPSLRSL